jgi:hypothetical protein
MLQSVMAMLLDGLPVRDWMPMTDRASLVEPLKMQLMMEMFLHSPCFSMGVMIRR